MSISRAAHFRAAFCLSWKTDMELPIESFMLVLETTPKLFTNWCKHAIPYIPYPNTLSFFPLRHDDSRREFYLMVDNEDFEICEIEEGIFQITVNAVEAKFETFTDRVNGGKQEIITHEGIFQMDIMQVSPDRIRVSGEWRFPTDKAFMVYLIVEILHTFKVQDCRLFDFDGRDIRLINKAMQDRGYPLHQEKMPVENSITIPPSPDRQNLINKVKELSLEGWKVSKIADHLSLGESTVLSYRKMSGIRKRKL